MENRKYLDMILRPETIQPIDIANYALNNISMNKDQFIKQLTALIISAEQAEFEKIFLQMKSKEKYKKYWL